MVDPARFGSRLWTRVGGPFLHREKQARYISISAVVVHGRLQDDLDDVDWKTLDNGQNLQDEQDQGYGVVKMFTLLIL